MIVQAFGGVARRLMLTLAALAVFMLVAGILGLTSFTITERRLRQLQGESLADVRQILTLAERSTNIAARAPDIAAARTTAELAERREQLRDMLAEFRRLAATLREQAFEGDPTGVPTIVRLAGRLEDITLNLISAVEELIAARDLGSRYRTAIESAEISLARVGTSLIGAGARPESVDIIEAARQTLAAARSIRSAEDLATLDTTRAAFDEALARYLSLADNAAMNADGGPGYGGLTDALRPVAASFDDRMHEISAAQRIRIFLAAVSGLSGQLTESVKTQALAVERQALERSEETIALLRTVRDIALGATAICFVTALFAIRSTMRDIVGNLRGATEALASLAAGDYEISAPGADRSDEIGDLARAFQIFRTQAIERERLAHEQIESAELQRVIFLNMNDGLALFDRRGRLRLWNPRFVALTGLSDDQARGDLDLTDILKGRGEPDVATRTLSGAEIDLTDLMADWPVVDSHFELGFPDGRSVEARTGAAPDGGFLVRLTDLTERKQLERQLHLAQRMEAIGQLTGGIAHDFNNILAAIVSNLQMILEQAPSQSPTRTRALRALSAAENGAATTHRLLAFARRQPLTPEPTDLRTLITDIADLLDSSIDSAIAFDLDIDPATPLAFVDPSQMENALINLIFNARDAVENGGQIVVAVKPRGAGHVQVSVSDTGCGMTPDVAARAFEPFFTTKPIGRGNGLGLSSVYGFVKQSGGQIHVDSAAGRGTVITMDLIAAPPQDGETAAAAAATGGSIRTFLPNEKHVLLVEDDPAVLASSLDLFASMGFQVTGVATGQAAVETLCRSPADLLFTDVMLGGGINGTQLAEIVRQRLPDLPVVFCSGVPQSVPGPLVMKPFRREVLLQALEAAFAAHEDRALSPGMSKT